MELSKYITSENMELRRSQIVLASYNPRVLSDEEKKTLKRGIKKYGLVGGIVVNKKEDMFLLVSGHQRITVMDELEKYSPDTKENDYVIRCDVIDVDDKTEKSLNILLNNPNAQGKWDDNKLRELIPDIDYKDAGLTDADLSLIGCDYLLKTEEENSIADALGDLTAPIQKEREDTKAEKQAERDAEREAKVQHMKDVKAQVRENAIKTAGQMDAYVMLSFDDMDAKMAFLQRFGYDVNSKFIKGEDFDMKCEVILD